MGTLLVLAGVGCASSAGGDRPAHATRLTRSFFVNPDGQAAQQVREWIAEGRQSEAQTMRRIASQPIATWFTGASDVRAQVAALTRHASASGQSALLVAYDIPGRDCGNYSAGGATSASAYRSWISQFAAGIEDRYATVILEPDAVPQMLSHCLSAAAVSEREKLLRFASGTLEARANVTVYLDAGNPGWINPPSALLGPLRRAGIGRVDGFSLNVSNFYTNTETINYGERLAHALGGGAGAHFVIDTGRNGNGPDRSGHDGPAWCNPPGRALGTRPTTSTGVALLDAYLWIKPPGTSDGSCRPGEPRAGQWWPQYALGLING
ncbi:MAG TPA: glycoside hydrolase family 6 protein [Solirubrobacteraceae bacterium]|jgi:endoglucanase